MLEKEKGEDHENEDHDIGKMSLSLPLMILKWVPLKKVKK
uniref:Bm6881 n=1 Tax=Brugia malayi TaxID=6279 RepID=A0A0I9R2S5_BRUMA|nr:Bm6881 [Brugia malayi]